MWPLASARRNAAVERQTGPYEVEAIIAPKTDAGAVGEAVALGRNGRGGRAKPLVLRGVERMVLIGAGEMAVQRVDIESVERSGFLEPQPQPVHSGIDHHVT